MKSPSLFRRCGVPVLCATSLLALVSGSRAADLIYFVTLDVGVLSNNMNGPFSLDFQLSRGSGNVTNSVTLSNFVLNGGGVDGPPNFTQGGESGDVTTSITLTNTAFNNELAQEFNPSVTSISFKVDETSNSETVGNGTPIPEQFSFYLDDNTGSFIPTTDQANSTLLTESITARQTVNSVNTYTSVSPNAGVTVSVSTVPEPGSAALLAFGGLALVVRRPRAGVARLA